MTREQKGERFALLGAPVKSTEWLCRPHSGPKWPLWQGLLLDFLSGFPMFLLGSPSAKGDLLP